MCGIAGALDLEGGGIPPKLIAAMSRAIAHRGPDDEGYVLINRADSRFAAYSGPDSAPEVRGAQPPLPEGEGPFRADLALAHRRLSIIDPAPRAHQPLFDRESSCCVVFNGAIYNYPELRSELQSDGCTFSTQSDTEVLLAAYKAWGADCFERFNGFWALAIYDLKERRLILSRDRVGKKPLYWTKCGPRVYFASEIKALLRVPEVEARKAVNEEAVYPFLAFSFRELGNSTFFEGIHQLPPASWAVVDGSFPGNARRFWALPAERRKEKEISVEEAAEAIRESLDDAVRLRLRADVPLGVELSGGLDSSSVLAFASRHHGPGLPAYTVRWSAEEKNEEPFARSVAEAFGAEYHPFDPPLEGFWQHIGDFTYLEEEPYHSPNLQTNQVIWTMQRSAGSKVALTGTGGDEIFAGYPLYYEKAQAEYLLRGDFGGLFRNARKWTEAPASFRSFVHPFLKLGRHVAKKLLPWLDRKARHAPFLRDRSGRPPDLFHPLLSQSMRRDFSEILVPYWLVTMDKGSMGIPLETRSPFLDYRLVELAYTLPTSYLVRDGWHKWILRKALEGVLPQDIVWRRRKMGLPFDYKRFLAKSRHIIDMILSEAHNPYIDLSMKDVLRGRWSALSFILWYEKFFNGNREIFSRIEDEVSGSRQITDFGYAPAFLGTSAGEQPE